LVVVVTDLCCAWWFVFLVPVVWILVPLAVVLCSLVVVQLFRRLSSLSLSRKPPQSLNLSPKHFFAAILTLYIVAFVFCFWSLVAIVH
jgi:hypothetical protein